MGIFSGLVAGSLVFLINLNHGFFAAFAGLGKQFLFNVLMAGYNARTCEKIVRIIRHPHLACFIGTIIPTTQAFVVLYSIHYFGGTPKPMHSTLWQGIINLFVFYYLAYYYKVKRFQSAELKPIQTQRKWRNRLQKIGVIRKAG